MYHDTIKIEFYVYDYGIQSTYNFLLSKIKNPHKGVLYSNILDKFNNIGLNTSFIRFPDYDGSETVYCSYNNVKHEIFFKAWEKQLKNAVIRKIAFCYGSMIKGVFYENNMNFYSSVLFVKENKSNGYKEEIMSGIYFNKDCETYTVVDRNGEEIYSLDTTPDRNFNHNFFENKEIQRYLRIYKLEQLMKIK